MFANDKGKLVIFGNPDAVSLQIYDTRHVLCHPLTTTCWDRTLFGCHWWFVRGQDGGSGAWCLPALWSCRCEQQQQLSGRDREPTAPSRRVQRTSLVLCEVCGCCCLVCLKMTASSHLKQGQTGMVSYVPKKRCLDHEHRLPRVLPGASNICTSIPPAAPTLVPEKLTSYPPGSGRKCGHFHLFHSWIGLWSWVRVTHWAVTWSLHPASGARSLHPFRHPMSCMDKAITKMSNFKCMKELHMFSVNQFPLFFVQWLHHCLISVPHKQLYPSIFTPSLWAHFRE